MRPNLLMRLSNRPENVALVDAALHALVEVLALDALAADDLRTAVLEACKNVVWHAYDGAEGPLELELSALAGEVQAVVRDRGIGIRPRVGERTYPHTGIGMPLIHVRSRRVTYTNLDGGGTEVRMELQTPGTVALSPGLSSPTRALAGDEPGSGSLELRAAPGELGKALLAWVPRALGARAELTAAAAPALARVSQALARQIPDAHGAGELALGAEVSTGAVELRLMDMAPGCCERLSARLRSDLGELAPLELRICCEAGADGRGERLSLALREPR